MGFDDLGWRRERERERLRLIVRERMPRKRMKSFVGLRNCLADLGSLNI